MKTKLNPAIFREAAERIEPFGFGACCCTALKHAVWKNPGDFLGESHLPYLKFFGSLFRGGHSWNVRWWGWSDSEPRILALLLAELIAKEKSK